MKITAFAPEGTQEVSERDLPALLASRTKTIWVDMIGPTEDDVHLMHEVFKFHHLAIEDTRNQRQRPKIEEYTDYLFSILNPIASVQDALSFGELDVFIGPNYVVSVHRDGDAVIEEAKRRLCRTSHPSQFSAGYVLYVLIDVVVDGYFPILDSIGEAIERLGDSIVKQARQESLTQLFELKSTLNEVWRVIAPQRDMFNILTHHDLPFIDQDTLEYYLRDVYDPLLRITDTVNTYRDTLTNIIDLYMSAVSNRLNQVVNRLTVITVIVGSMSVISGFYGMNFEHNWPPFSTFWGVPVVLGLMALFTTVLLFVFRRLGWY